MKKMKVKLAFLFLCIIGLSSCDDYVPKPYAYPRVNYPDKHYNRIQFEGPFEFDIPVYALVNDEREAVRRGDKYWYNITFPIFDATVHMSYKSIDTDQQLYDYIEDSRKMVFKHTIKAEEIEERSIKDSSKNIQGMLYTLTGSTATSLNFFLSDQEEHFVRGAFYFDHKTANDSIQPIKKFIEEDILRMINSFEWKEETTKKTRRFVGS